MNTPEAPIFSWRRTFWLLLIAAVGLRAVYWHQLNATHFVEKQVEGRFTDMAFFDEWARGIADGDLLSTEIGHPVNDNARRMLLDHWRAEGVVKPEDEHDPVRLRDRIDERWNQWYGEGSFHQAPLFPYLLAAAYAVAGAAPTLWILLQMGIGLLNLAMVVDITRRLYDDWAARLAGILCLAITPIWFYEGVLLRTTLIQFVTLGIAWTLIRDTRAHWRGLLTAAAILIKPVFLLAVPLCLLARERRLGAYALGLALGLAPALIRNAAVDRPLFELSCIGPTTLIRSNAPDVTAGDGWQTSVHTVPILEKHGNDLTAAAGELVGRRGAGDWLRHLGAKLYHLVHDYEIPNNVDFMLMAHDIPVMDFGFGVGILFPLALFGLPGLVRRHRLALPLIGVALVHVVTAVVFYNLGRFRAPLAVCAVPLAAAGAGHLWRLLSEEDRPQLATWSMILLGLGGFATLTHNDNSRLKQAEREMITHNFGLARARAERVLESNPEAPYANWVAAQSNIATGRVDEAIEKNFPRCRRSFRFRMRALSREGGIHFRRAQKDIRDAAAALDAAALRYGQAMLTNPFSPSARANLGLVREYQGELDMAHEQYLAATYLDPDHAPGHAGLGNIALIDNDDRLAVACYRRAIRLLLDDAYAREALGRGRLPTLAVYRYRLGLALRGLGRNAEARQAFRDALDAQPDHKLSEKALRETPE